MTSFLSRIFSVFKVKENRTKDTFITVNVIGTEITANSADIHSSKEDLADLRNRRFQRYRRYGRQIRHKKIWAILNYAKSLEAIYDSNNFYDLDKAFIEYQNTLARFDDPGIRPSDNEFQCAFRFCDIQHYIGECDHKLSETEKQSISNWTTISLDYANILNAVSKRFIEYWDRTLNNYKTKAQYLNRLEYLIHHLDEVKCRKGLSTIPQLDDYINIVRDHYTNLKFNTRI